MAADLTRSRLADGNGDGWDDLWQAIFVTQGAERMAAEADPDADGWPNWWEMVRFQDPFTPDELTGRARSSGLSKPPLLVRRFGPAPKHPRLAQPRLDAGGRPFPPKALRRRLEADADIDGRAATVEEARRRERVKAWLQSTGASDAPQDVVDGRPRFSKPWGRDQGRLIGTDAFWTLEPILQGGQPLEFKWQTVGFDGAGTRIALWEPEGRPLDYVTAAAGRLGHRAFWGAHHLAHSTPAPYRIEELPGAATLPMQNHPTSVASVLGASALAGDAVDLGAERYPIEPPEGDGRALPTLGMAPRCRIVAGDSASALTQLRDAAIVPALPPATGWQSYLFISNHSYGEHVGWEPSQLIASGWDSSLAEWKGGLSPVDPAFGAYGTNARGVDVAAFQRRYHLTVWAAGNDRLTTHRSAGSPVWLRGVVADPAATPAPYATASSDPSTPEAPALEAVYLTFPEGASLIKAYAVIDIQPGNENFYGKVYRWSNPNAPFSTTVSRRPETTVLPATWSRREGRAPASAEDPGGWDTITDYQVAKNCLTVGAIRGGVEPPTAGEPLSPPVGRLSAWEFSACGPVDDGRLKPEVVAPGVDISVATADGSRYPEESQSPDYAEESGTSFSAPAAAGLAHLLTHRYAAAHTQGNGTTEWPTAALVKALLVHTADDLVSVPGTAVSAWGPVRPVTDETARFKPGPDYSSGYGLVDGAEAQALIAQDAVADGSGQWLRPHLKMVVYTPPANPALPGVEFPMVASGQDDVKVTLSWTDWPGPAQPPGTIQSTARLTNDFDLRVTGPDASAGGASTTFFPWVLDPAHPLQAATPGDNVVDPLEQVLIPRARVVPGGVYQVTVHLKGSLTFPTLPGETANPTPGQHELALVVTGQGSDLHGTPPLAISALSLHDSWHPDYLVARIHWLGVPGSTYDVEESTDLQTWTTTATSLSCAYLAMTHETNPFLRTAPQRFFRLRQTLFNP